MGIIHTSFLSKSTLQKYLHHVVIYVEYWTFQYTKMMTIFALYFVFSFLTYQVSYSKKYKSFQKKTRNLFLRLAFKPYFAKLIFSIDSSKLYFADQIFAIRAKVAKISSAVIYSAIIYDCKNFCLKDHALTGHSLSQAAFTYLNSTMETSGQWVKSV